ncbi:folylpolyglutamate synthase/dihydrofolate synthase family protein [uncultured Negativibacillus sp.]|uniref:bifunctional folylpolyglutamate synthase/dihydrofolate synthase n=1 Tax=uncultured Negativibacillus sp. TaxID=1980696 RepID=UPI0025F208D7|nr:folylpolyglutamate synthase/dihydrofolate synthase family protein [uncultured Negativibacillus sp.]
MDYRQAVEFVESSSIVRERYGLEKLQQALHLLGDPHHHTEFVHIAGTNGKGSTAAMTASVLQTAGYRTGLYTSPHLMRYNERMHIDGVPISDEDFVEAASQVQRVCEQLGGVPIVFEVLTLMALWYFAQQHCDIVVLEVGIGGLLDSTNVIPSPKVAIITQLGMDHTETLGNTLEEIAAQKGGIVKEGTPTVMALQEPSAVAVVQQICDKYHAPLALADPERLRVLDASVAGQTLEDREYGKLMLPLAGAHQRKNAANVLEAVAMLRTQGYRISDDDVREGIAKTVWPARFERLSTAPDFILDGGHNPQCLHAATAALREYYPGQKVVFLVGMMADKDTDHMLAEMASIAKSFVCIRPDSPRAMQPQLLAQQLTERFHLPACACGSVREGIAEATRQAGKEGVVCALGSLYLAGEVRAAFGR